jgi:electron transfer flavoprotein beta subunit
MKSMDIIVCMKPVPDPDHWDKLKLDPETMLLCRNEVPAVINPLDRNAIEQAVFFKEKFGGTVSVLTMAVPDAEEQLQEALAMGCCIKAAIEKIGRYDMIFCGGYSLDGSTAQVGPQVAELLGVPDLTHAFKLELNTDFIRAYCKLENGYAIY